MYQRIIVPLDGSELAEQALPQAEALARLLAVPMHLVRVIDFNQFLWYGQYGMAMEYASSEQVVANELALVTAYLQTAAKRIGDSGLVVDMEIRRGLPVTELVATSKPGDLIVMASHGRGGIRRWFLGSVAESLLRHAEVPILLVKSGEEGTKEIGLTTSLPEMVTI